MAKETSKKTTKKVETKPKSHKKHEKHKKEDVKEENKTVASQKATTEKKETTPKVEPKKEDVKKETSKVEYYTISFQKGLTHLFVGVLLTLVAVSTLSWYYVSTSVNNAFLNVSTALEDGDYKGFEEYADMDAIATNIMEDSLESTKRVFEDDSAQIQQIEGLTDEQKQTQIESIKTSFKQGIISGDFLQDDYKPGNLYEAFTEVDFQSSGDEVILPFKIQNNTGEPQEFDLVFKQVDGQWKIVEFRIDFDKINEEAKKQQEEFLKQQEEMQAQAEAGPSGEETSEE